jgi:hypothetical protein
MFTISKSHFNFIILKENILKKKFIPLSHYELLNETITKDEYKAQYKYVSKLFHWLRYIKPTSFENSFYFDILIQFIDNKVYFKITSSKILQLYELNFHIQIIQPDTSQSYCQFCMDQFNIKYEWIPFIVVEKIKKEVLMELEKDFRFILHSF